MKLARRAISVVVAAIAAAAIVLSATPVAAAELPDGDGLYVIATDEGLFQLWQLLAVDPTTANTSLIGESTTAPGEDFQVQGSYDRETGIAYFIGSTDVSQLMIVDLVTGSWVEVGPIVVDPDGDPLYPSVTAMAIGAGSSAFVVTESNQLYSVDLATGEATFIANYSHHFHSFAYDAVTDAFYGLDSSDNLYTMDITNGNTTLVTSVTTTDPLYYYPYSLQFDSAGALWVLLNDDFGEADYLYSFTLADPTLVPSGVLNYGGDPFVSISLLIGPAQTPVLPATGAEPGLALGIAGLLIAGGVAFVLVRRRAAVA